MTAAVQTDERADWLAWRRGGLGGSDIAGVLGLSPWESAWSIWADKCGLVSRDMGDDVPDHIDFGRRAEPMLADWFHDKTGLYVAGDQTWCTHPSEPWMRCTVDGFVCECHDGHSVNINDALGLVEFKTSSDSPWDEVPPHYQTQAQWSMAVTGLPMCWFGVLHLAFGRPSFRVYELARDEADIALLTARGREFWFEHVLTGTPPPTDAHSATTEALNAAWTPSDGECVYADDNAVLLVENLRALKAEAKALDENVAAHENALRALLGEATALVDGLDDKGKPVVLATWKPQTADRLDMTAIRKAHPDLCAEFIKTTESRVLRLKLSKGE